MFQLIKADPPGDQVRLITFVPFLADGRCVLIEEPGGPALPAGEVQDGEDYVIDTVLRVPLLTAGFRYQRFHPFGLDRDHLYAWIEGGPYTGLAAGPAAHHRGDRRRRDVPGRRLAVEPYGVDISPALAELARQRLPQWADRIWIGNAVDWQPPAGLRFDYVHILLDSVPRSRRADGNNGASLLSRQQQCSIVAVRPGARTSLVMDGGPDTQARKDTRQPIGR